MVGFVVTGFEVVCGNLVLVARPVVVGFERVVVSGVTTVETDIVVIAGVVTTAVEYQLNKVKFSR